MSTLTFNPVFFLGGYVIGTAIIYAIIWWKRRDGE
jgi:hypothetical protein